MGYCILFISKNSLKCTNSPLKVQQYYVSYIDISFNNFPERHWKYFLIVLNILNLKAYLLPNLPSCVKEVILQHKWFIARESQINNECFFASFYLIAFDMNVLVSNKEILVEQELYETKIFLNENPPPFRKWSASPLNSLETCCWAYTFVFVFWFSTIFETKYFARHSSHIA